MNLSQFLEIKFNLAAALIWMILGLAIGALIGMFAFTNSGDGIISVLVFFGLLGWFYGARKPPHKAKIAKKPSRLQNIMDAEGQALNTASMLSDILPPPRNVIIPEEITIGKFLLGLGLFFVLTIAVIKFQAVRDLLNENTWAGQIFTDPKQSP